METKHTTAGKRNAVTATNRTGDAMTFEAHAYLCAVIAQREDIGAGPTHAVWVTDDDIDSMLSLVSI